MNQTAAARAAAREIDLEMLQRPDGRYVLAENLGLRDIRERGAYDHTIFGIGDVVAGEPDGMTAEQVIEYCRHHCRQGALA